MNGAATLFGRKTLGAAMAAAVLLVASPANAVINLTPDPAATPAETAGKVKIARETLLMGDANTTTAKGVTYYNVTDAGAALNVQVDRGIVAGTSTVYYRLSFENMVFAGTTAPTVADAGTGVAVGPLGGGAAGDNYVLFATAGNGAATDNLTVTIGALGVLPDMPGNVKVEVYRDAFDAQAATNAIGSLTKMMSGAVTVVDGISERGTPGMAVAEVSENFMQLTGGAEMASIGRLRITLNTTALTQTTAVIDDIQDVLGATAPAVVTFKGDFSVGTYSLNSNMNCAEDNDPSTVVASTVGDEGDMEKVKLTPDEQPLATATGIDWYLCLMVDEDNDMALPTGAFTATVEYGALANVMGGGRADQTVTIGSIGRNGTSVHIPFITTSDNKHQRITMSNRGSANAAYAFSFRPEMGVTATPGMAATGTLGAGMTMTYHVRDIVTLSGGVRTAATVSFVAQQSDIDVASTITNRSTGAQSLETHTSN